MKKYLMVALAVIIGMLLIAGGVYGLSFPFEKSDIYYKSYIGGAYFMVVMGIGMIVYVIRNPLEWKNLRVLLLLLNG